jgi:hypothetical protein
VRAAEERQPWERAFCGHTKRSSDWCRRTRRCARSSRRCGGSAKMRRSGGATRAVCRCPATRVRARACACVRARTSAHAQAYTQRCSQCALWRPQQHTKRPNGAYTKTRTLGQTLRTRHGHGGSGAKAPGQHGTRAQATRRRFFRLGCCPGLGSSFGTTSGEVRKYFGCRVSRPLIHVRGRAR